MKVIRFILKVVSLPAVAVLTVIQWLFVFLIGFSSVVINLLAGLFLMVAVLSYLMGLSSGMEALRIIAAGFVIFMVPIAGEWFMTMIAAVSTGLRDFIRS